MASAFLASAPAPARKQNDTICADSRAERELQLVWLTCAALFVFACGPLSLSGGYHGVRCELSPSEVQMLRSAWFSTSTAIGSASFAYTVPSGGFSQTALILVAVGS